MANVEWVMRNYDLAGDGVAANDMNIPPSSSNIIKHATSRQLSLALNGIDDLSFQIYLDDPMATEIRRLNNVIKLWRTVRDDAGNVLYADTAGSPCFAGVVGSTIKDGDSNLMTIRAFSPFWRLQFRFHLLNHYLVINVDTDSEFTQSELMWKIIDLINEAFGYQASSESFTGIGQGTFSAAVEPIAAPFYVPKGSNSYTNIFETIMNLSGGVDIIPDYFHDDGDPTLMLFSTDEKRGQDLSATLAFNYHTGADDTLDNLTEEETPIPNEFANFLWAVGSGGPNSGKVALEENISDDENGYANIGVYMRKADFNDVQILGELGPPKTDLYALAEAEFNRSKTPKTTYSISLSPGSNIYYGNDYSIGDVGMLNAGKGALQVIDVKQRIYEATLSMSDNNIETSNLTIADDFFGKVAT